MIYISSVNLFLGVPIANILSFNAAFIHIKIIKLSLFRSYKSLL